MEAYPTFTFPELLQDMITSKHFHKHFANEELLRDLWSEASNGDDVQFEHRIVQTRDGVLEAIVLKLHDAGHEPDDARASWATISHNTLNVTYCYSDGDERVYPAEVVPAKPFLFKRSTDQTCQLSNINALALIKPRGLPGSKRQRDENPTLIFEAGIKLLFLAAGHVQTVSRDGNGSLSRWAGYMTRLLLAERALTCGNAAAASSDSQASEPSDDEDCGTQLSSLLSCTQKTDVGAENRRTRIRTSTDIEFDEDVGIEKEEEEVTEIKREDSTESF